MLLLHEFPVIIISRSSVTVQSADSIIICLAHTIDNHEDSHDYVNLLYGIHMEMEAVA